MKKYFPKLIHETQTGFMSNRHISTTLTTTIDISKYGKRIQGYLLTIDFLKCFDRIEYGSILGSLNLLGFGKKYQEWCKLLMTEFESVTSNNGFFSEYINVERSCHQGCPATPLFYLACGEVLSREIRKNSNIKGITLNGLEHIIAQFADDTQFFLKNKESLQEVVKTLDIIEANIGLKVNYDKSNIYRIGNVEKLHTEQPIVWDPGGLEILGFSVTNTVQENYSTIISKAQAILKTWYARQLTLMGKVMIINTLISLLFAYVMQVELDLPQNILNQYDQIIMNFLWSGKKSKIKTSALQASKDKAGLQLVNLKARNQAIKATWIFREDPVTRAQIEQIVPKCLGNLFWQCNLKPIDAENYLKNKNVNPFWIGATTHWFTLLNKQRKRNTENQVQDILWLNLESEGK